jgi:hypothetical protein
MLAAQTHVLVRAATGIGQFGKYISGDDVKESERGRAWGREGKYTVFCFGHLRERNHVEDLGVDGTIIDVSYINGMGMRVLD